MRDVKSIKHIVLGVLLLLISKECDTISQRSVEIMTFGELIRAKMQERDLSMRDLERMTGIDIAKISRIANDQIQSPAYSNVVKIKNALEINNFDVESAFDVGNKSSRDQIDRLNDNPILLQLQRQLLASSDLKSILDVFQTISNYFEAQRKWWIIAVIPVEPYAKVLQLNGALSSEQFEKWKTIFMKLFLASEVLAAESIIYPEQVIHLPDDLHVFMSAVELVEKIRVAYTEGTISESESTEFLNSIFQQNLINKVRLDEILKCDEDQPGTEESSSKHLEELIFEKETELFRLKQMAKFLKPNDEIQAR